MFFNQPMILHSTRSDGRHWLTSMDFPPLQILPVEGNQCRVGHTFALILSSILADLKLDLPCEITLTIEDLEKAPNMRNRFNSQHVSPEGVRVCLELQSGPEPDEDGDELNEDVEFVTPVPPSDWTGTYDQWVFETTSALGLEPPDPMPGSAYEASLSDAICQAQKKIPELRDRFVKGMNGLNLGLKIGLETKSGGIEYVWTRPTDWSDPDTVLCILESQPHDCKGYKAGQKLTLKIADIIDYGIGSEDAGLVEPGFTQRIAEDFGHVLS